MNDCFYILRIIILSFVGLAMIASCAQNPSEPKKTLPDSDGPYAVSRGDSETRIITLRNLTWTENTYNINLDDEIGIAPEGVVTVVQLHPFEKVLGTFDKGEEISVISGKPPFQFRIMD